MQVRHASKLNTSSIEKTDQWLILYSPTEKKIGHITTRRGTNNGAPTGLFLYF